MSQNPDPKGKRRRQSTTSVSSASGPRNPVTSPRIPAIVPPNPAKRVEVGRPVSDDGRASSSSPEVDIGRGPTFVPILKLLCTYQVDQQTNSPSVVVQHLGTAPLPPELANYIRRLGHNLMARLKSRALYIEIPLKADRKLEMQARGRVRIKYDSVPTPLRFTVDLMLHEGRWRNSVIPLSFLEIVQYPRPLGILRSPSPPSAPRVPTLAPAPAQQPRRQSPLPTNPQTQRATSPQTSTHRSLQPPLPPPGCQRDDAGAGWDRRTLNTLGPEGRRRVSWHYIDVAFRSDGTPVLSLARNQTLRGWTLDWTEAYAELVAGLREVRRLGFDGTQFQIRVEHNHDNFNARRVDWLRYLYIPSRSWLNVTLNPPSLSSVRPLAPFAGSSQTGGAGPSGQASGLQTRAQSPPRSTADPPQPPIFPAGDRRRADLRAAVASAQALQDIYGWHDVGIVRHGDILHLNLSSAACPSLTGWPLVWPAGAYNAIVAGLNALNATQKAQLMPSGGGVVHLKVSRNAQERKVLGARYRLVPGPRRRTALPWVTLWLAR